MKFLVAGILGLILVFFLTFRIDILLVHTVFEIEYGTPGVFTVYRLFEKVREPANFNGIPLSIDFTI